jgi:thioredoxin-like negative regulator of GroEL
MGLLDMFSRKGPGAIRKHAARVGNKRAQNPDRWESIHALAAMRSVEAVEGLLRRFTFRMDPSITDQEEKDAAFHGIVAAGDVAVEPVREFLHRADAISWPLKMLEQLLPPEEVVRELLDLLARMDTEYERDPEKKIQLLAYLEDRQDPRIVPAVTPFLDDVNETVRFHAAGAIFAQNDPEHAKEALLDVVAKEESMRVRARILDGFLEREWPIPKERIEAVRPKLPGGWALDPQGMPRKG